MILFDKIKNEKKNDSLKKKKKNANGHNKCHKWKCSVAGRFQKFSLKLYNDLNEKKENEKNSFFI